jgi:hypothetical protein
MTTIAIDPAATSTTSSHPNQSVFARLHSAPDIIPGAAAIRERRRGPDRGRGSDARPDRTLQRPGYAVLSESIPIYFVGQNHDGFWVARDGGGNTGGLFLLKRSALAFAHGNCLPAGCAIVLLSERFELDVPNRGNPLIVLIEFIKQLVRRKVF